MVVLKDYQDIIGKKNINQIKSLALLLKGKKIVMVNSTKDGGGVAEILQRLVPLLNELDIDCRWEVMEGDRNFFGITKNIHNSLQGEKISFNNEDFSQYLEINKRNAKNLDLGNADIVVIHDPQPLPLRNYYSGNKTKWVWRCHIDMSKPDLALWKFLQKYVMEYDCSIFSISKFSKSLPHPQYLIAPSIDPLSDKNCELDENKIEEVLRSFNIKKDKPIILQVSRFDRFKDPIGVMRAFRLVRKEVDCRLILAGGLASDDPEGKTVFEEVKKEAAGDPDIDILLLESKSDIEINALQRIADVVIQKSIKEGFGLVVTEAMWKEKAVIGGNVGGITIQLYNHRTGFLVNSLEGAAYRIRYLLNRPDIANKIGKQARDFVTQNFLITRHLRDYMALFFILDNPDQNIIYI
ncbi:MAG: glycosyltransferase [Actinobacteria bacterium]|nr:glycosyltransferase [Actinomycetota bacterium]